MVDDTPVLLKLAIGANMVAMFVVYTALPPLSWGRTLRFKLAAFGVLLAVDLLLFLTLGPESSWTLTFVAVAAAMQAYPGRTGYYLIAGLSASALLLQLAAGGAWEQSLVQPAIILSGGLMMHAFGRQTETVRQLRRAQNELAALAVAEERNRVARDMHDILGHSLTVIAVKAELAGRLIVIAPEKAAAGGRPAGGPGPRRFGGCPGHSQRLPRREYQLRTGQRPQRAGGGWDRAAPSGCGGRGSGEVPGAFRRGSLREGGDQRGAALGCEPVHGHPERKRDPDRRRRPGPGRGLPAGWGLRGLGNARRRDGRSTGAFGPPRRAASVCG